MPLHLLRLTTNKNESDPENRAYSPPKTWTARYQADTQEGRGADNPGSLFWFEIDVTLDEDGFRSRVELAPQVGYPSMAQSLEKLAQWAAMTAQAIRECELPDEGFPSQIKRKAVSPC